MTRKNALAVVGLVVVIAAVWFLFLRGGGKPAEPTTGSGSGRDGKIALPAAGSGAVDQHPTETSAAPPRGMAPRWQVDLDPPGTERLEGQVLDPEGHGVGGAEVILTSSPPRKTTTEGDGTFAFDKLVERTYSVSATSGDLIGGPVAARVSATKPEPAVIHLGHGAVLAVTVLDEDKHPIAGATVSESDLREFTTDDKGVALVKPVRLGWVGIDVHKDGFAANDAMTPVGGGRAELTVTLHKGYAVSGRVVDDGGHAVAHVRVRPSGMFGFEAADKGVDTDEKGAFTIAALAPGRHVLDARDTTHAPAQSAPVTVVDRAVTNVDITMKAGGAIAGVVVGADKNPVGFATVRAQVQGQRGYQDSFRQVTADKAGAFTITGLSRTSIDLRAETDTAASKLTPVDLSKDLEKKGVTLVLDVQGGISGVVVDDKGGPVAEVQVNAFVDMWGSSGSEDAALAGMSTATTAGDGTFSIHGLPDGNYKLFAARNSSTNRDWGKSSVAAKVGDKGVRITLPSPGKLTGKVALDGQSSPPKSAFVQIGYQASQPVAADGTFSVGELSPGQYEVTFRGPEFAPLVKHDVKIEAGQTTDLGSVTVMRGRKLSGKVVDASGNPVGGATVKVAAMLFSVSGAEEQMANIEEQQGVRTAISDTNGGFAIIGLTSAATNVAADHPDQGRSNAVSIPEGKDDPAPVTLALRGFGSITGKVTMKGAPMPGMMVTVAAKGGGAQMQMVQTADDGSFLVPKVPEGATVLAAMQQGGQGMSMKSTSTTVTVVAKQQTTVNLEIPVGTIALTVTCKPLPAAKVDAAQVFLFRGTIAATTAKQVTDLFIGGAVQGMKFWLGDGKPMPEFDELVAGPYTACAIPITGNLADASFQQKLQQHLAALAVVCKPVALAPTPQTQAIEVDLPTMPALPTD